MMAEPKSGLARWLAGLVGKRIVVWGDLVGDHTVYGDTERISREAPVLILTREWDTVTPGCAGNAVMNVASLGGVPVPVGIVGDDAMGARLIDELMRRGIDTGHVIRQAGGETAVKMRVLAGGLHTVKQQVIRIDSDGAYGAVESQTLKERLAEALQGADAVIVSDYGLGTVREDLFRDLVRGGSMPSVIDSRHDLLRFGGATSATPNEPELEEAARSSVGDDDSALDRAARDVLGKLKLKALLVTRGRRGMALYEPRKGRIDIPVAREQEIVDVTGAGDTVIAAYTLGLAAGAPFADAARLANVAAGLAVMKRGAVAPERSDVERAVGDLGETGSGKGRD